LRRTPRISRPSFVVATMTCAPRRPVRGRAAAGGGSHRRVRIQDLLAQRRNRREAGRRQIGYRRAAAAVDLMTARAGRAAEEQRFARLRVAGDARRIGSARGCCRRRRTRQAADVRHELPDLLIGEAPERRHLRARNAFADGVEQIAVLVAVRERAGIERGPAIAASGRRVTRHARLVVEAAAVAIAAGLSPSGLRVVSACWTFIPARSGIRNQIDFIARIIVQFRNAD
jgi:hypothetical protein